MAWVPETENIYFDSFDFISSNPIAFDNLGVKKVAKIFCNINVCHVITEEGTVYSWGNDREKYGTLAMGNNYYITSPTLNNNFDGKKILDLSIGEKHAAAIDEAHNIYMWGTDYYGECGYGDYNEKEVTKNIPFSLNIKHLYPLKVKCGYSYTMILDYDNTAIYLGVICDKNIIQDNIEKIERDAKHRVPFDNSLNVRCNEIYCGLNMIAIVDTKGNLFLYSDYEGLYYVRIPFEAITVKFVYDVIYVGINNKDYIYEFAPMRGRQCLEDYIENLYKVDECVSNIDIIDTPYYDNVLFFSIESEREMKRRNEDVNILRLIKENLNSQFGESNEEEIMNNNGRFNSSCSSLSSIYNSKSGLNLNINNSNTIIYNRSISRQHTIISGANSFASITNSFNSSNNLDSPSSMNMKKSYKRINRISSLLGRLFDKKIENISKGNIIINNKKRIDVELLVSGWNGKRAMGLKGSHQRSMSCVNLDDADSMKKNRNIRSLSSEKRLLDVNRLILKDNRNLNSFRKSIKKVLGIENYNRDKEDINEKKEEKRNFIDMKKIMSKMKVDKEKKDIIVNNRYQTVSVENNSHTSEEDRKLEEAINISNHKKKEEVIKEERLIGSRREIREGLIEGKDYDRYVFDYAKFKDDSYLIERNDIVKVPKRPRQREIKNEEISDIKDEIEMLEPKSNIEMILTNENKRQIDSKGNIPIEGSIISNNEGTDNISNNTRMTLKGKKNPKTIKRKKIEEPKEEEKIVNNQQKKERDKQYNIVSMVIDHNQIEIQSNNLKKEEPNIIESNEENNNSPEDNNKTSLNSPILHSFIQEEFHHQYVPVQYQIFHKSSPTPRLKLPHPQSSSLSKIVSKYESSLKSQTSKKKQSIQDPIANLLNDINILSPIDSVNPMISINSANTYYINETPLQLTSTPSTESRRPLMLTETKLNSISINPKESSQKSLTIEHINLNITTPKKSKENTSMIYAGLISKKQRINRDKLNKFLVSSNTDRSSIKISREQTTPIKLISNPVVNNRTITNDIRPRTSALPSKQYLPFTEKKVEKRKLIHKSNKTLKPAKIKQRNSSASTNNNSLSSTVPIHKRQRSANQLNHPSSFAVSHHKHNMSTSRLTSLRENYIGYYERALKYSNNKMITTLLTPEENTTAQKIVDIIDNEETLMSGVSHTSDNKTKTFNDIQKDIKNYVINNKDKYRNDYNKNDFIPIVTRSDIGDNMIQIEPSCHNSMIGEPLELERSQIK